MLFDTLCTYATYVIYKAQQKAPCATERSRFCSFWTATVRKTRARKNSWKL